MHSPPANDFGFGLASVRIACLILAMRFRFKIRSLLVLTTLAGVIGAYYLSVQSGVKEEQRVLDEFKQQGIDLSVRNEPIVRDWSWNCIRQTINWPWHTMTGKDIPHCRGLTLVVTDESARKTGIRNHSASGQRTAATFPRRRASAVKGLLTGSSRQFRKRDRPP